MCRRAIKLLILFACLGLPAMALAVAPNLGPSTPATQAQIAALQQELLQPAYAHSVIFVAWEHFYMQKFAEQILKSYGGNSSRVPDWPGSDYETIYVIHITRTASGAAPHATFEIQQENLGSKLKDVCPEPE